MSAIRKRFGATIALDGVDLSVNSGEVHSLVGENGAGKTTLMKILSGAHRADSGSMWLDREPYRPRSPLDGRLAGVSMIYQELSLTPHLSIAENILLGMEPSRGPFLQRSEIRRRAVDAMRQVGLYHRAPRFLVSRLSPAEQQLVEIARAVSVGCRILVLDEPTSSLGQEDTRRLFRLIRRLKRTGHGIVYISHSLEGVQQISDRYTVLRDGRTVCSGKTKETSAGEMATMMVGRKVQKWYPRSKRKPGEVVLEVKDLAGRRYPREASLLLRRGEILGLAGLVGAGRTELLRSIFGLNVIREGRIKVGTYIGPASPARRWLQGVGLVSEDRKQEGIALSLSLADNLTLSKLSVLGPVGLVFQSRQDAAAQRWIDRLGIKCQGPRQLCGYLSGGNQQKVALARLLHHDVDILLLDEPTRGIDVGSKAQIFKLMDRLATGGGSQGKVGKALLMVSSYLPELLGVCDRIAVMRKGVLSPARPVDELDEHGILVEATMNRQNASRNGPR